MSTSVASRGGRKSCRRVLSSERLDAPPEVCEPEPVVVDGEPEPTVADLSSVELAGLVDHGFELSHERAGTLELGRDRRLANKVRDPSEAEELVQRTFVACVEARDGFAGRSSFRAYLLGIARFQCYKHWGACSANASLDDIEISAIADLSDRPSSILAKDATQRMLLEALRRIPLRDQVIVELYYWEELSGRELGEVLGLSEETARSRLRAAKRSLHKAVRRMENLTGLPESTDEDLEGWARKLRNEVDRR